MVPPALSCYPLLLFTLLAACSAPKTHYLLRPLAPTGQNAVSASPGEKGYALRTLTLAQYLDEPALLYLKTANQVAIEKNHLWTEDLRRNIRQVLQQDLSALSGRSVHAYPLPGNLRPERIVDVQIAQMIASQADKTFVVSATWQISAVGAAHPPSHHFARRYPMTRITPTQIAAACQRALTDLANAIAATLALR